VRPGDWLAPVTLEPCIECRLQTLVLRKGSRVVNRLHTGSGKWVVACDMAQIDRVMW
jgi:hypothetical protein